MYDAECRHLRGQAIRAGERLTHTTDDNNELIDKCRRNGEIVQTENACDRNSHEMGKILGSSCSVSSHINHASCEKLADYFEKLSNPLYCDYFDKSYEGNAVYNINSFHIKDLTNDGLSEESRLELDVINSLFSKIEIEDAINC